MTIDEAIKRVRMREVLFNDKLLRETLASLFEAGGTWALDQLRSNVAEYGPDVLLDERIDILAGRTHGMIAFRDGVVEAIL
ncbi:MAG TPA: hypothetical protein VGR71_16645 [Nitrospira sp.]|nr:hypothetical protein [Nitrospira sp.]